MSGSVNSISYRLGSSMTWGYSTSPLFVSEKIKNNLLLARLLPSLLSRFGLHMVEFYSFFESSLSLCILVSKLLTLKRRIRRRYGKRRKKKRKSLRRLTYSFNKNFINWRVLSFVRNAFRLHKKVCRMTAFQFSFKLLKIKKKFRKIIKSSATIKSFLALLKKRYFNHHSNLKFFKFRNKNIYLRRIKIALSTFNFGSIKKSSFFKKRFRFFVDPFYALRPFLRNVNKRTVKAIMRSLHLPRKVHFKRLKPVLFTGFLYPTPANKFLSSNRLQKVRNVRIRLSIKKLLLRVKRKYKPTRLLKRFYRIQAGKLGLSRTSLSSSKLAKKRFFLLNSILKQKLLSITFGRTYTELSLNRSLKFISLINNLALNKRNITKKHLLVGAKLRNAFYLPSLTSLRHIFYSFKRINFFARRRSFNRRSFNRRCVNKILLNKRNAFFSMSGQKLEFINTKLLKSKSFSYFNRRFNSFRNIKLEEGFENSSILPLSGWRTYKCKNFFFKPKFRFLRYCSVARQVSSLTRKYKNKRSRKVIAKIIKFYRYSRFLLTYSVRKAFRRFFRSSRYFHWFKYNLFLSKRFSTHASNRLHSPIHNLQKFKFISRKPKLNTFLQSTYKNRKLRKLFNQNFRLFLTNKDSLLRNIKHHFNSDIFIHKKVIASNFKLKLYRQKKWIFKKNFEFFISEFISGLITLPTNVFFSDGLCLLGKSVQVERILAIKLVFKRAFIHKKNYYFFKNFVNLLFQSIKFKTIWSLTRYFSKVYYYRKTQKYTTQTITRIFSTMELRTLRFVGLNILISGKIGRRRRAKSICFTKNKLPNLASLNLKVQYCYTQCITNFGVYGIKVWLYHY